MVVSGNPEVNMFLEKTPETKFLDYVYDYLSLPPITEYYEGVPYLYTYEFVDSRQFQQIETKEIGMKNIQELVGRINTYFGINCPQISRLLMDYALGRLLELRKITRKKVQ